jgi:hypothetical protein
MRGGAEDSGLLKYAALIHELTHMHTHTPHYLPVCQPNCGVCRALID